MDRDYLAWIRILPCIVCAVQAGYIPSETFDSEPHHIPPKGHGSMGKKTSDLRTIPLCRLHHQETHQKGRDTFEEKYQLDYEYIIKRLQEAYGILD